MVKKELLDLRDLMKKHLVECYIVLTNDYHLSEYLGEYFKERVFLSGFTGSNGNLIITQDEAKLWTDGRYFIQAENQLKNTGIELMKIGEPNVPTILEYLNQKRIKRIGINLKLTPYGFYESLKRNASNIEEIQDLDLVDSIWKNRPSLSKQPAFLLNEEFSGESYLSKFQKVLNQMKEWGSENYLFTRLDDINYLLNMRGRDIAHTPYFLSYFLIKENQAYLYANEIFDDQLLAYLKDNAIQLRPYFAIYEDIKSIHKNIVLDKASVNASLINHLNSEVEIIHKPNITQKMKAVKNDTEITNTKHCHIKDGVAILKIMKYIKESEEDLTELKVQDKLDEYRSLSDNYFENSFGTICAYQENAAMMHYSATPESNKKIEGNGLLLIDSGGQYLEGTTDITRTFVIGKISEELKKQYTLVLKGMINLSRARFLFGCRGVNLDILARGPIWNHMLDYKCGTGHGVSHVGGVHEGPNGFRWKIVEERNDSCILEPGMITTNEPGIYIENSHGIRIENELLCKYVSENEYGKFLEFETITMAPIDLDGIDLQYLNREEIDFLNLYHQRVYEKLSIYLNSEEQEFLKKYTKRL